MRIRTLRVLTGVVLFVLLLSAANADAAGRFYFGFGWSSPAYVSYGYYYRPYPYWHRAYGWAPHYYAPAPVGVYYHYGRPSYKVYRRVVVPPPAAYPGGVIYQEYIPRSYGRVYAR
jgi:hypothetical protein